MHLKLPDWYLNLSTQNTKRERIGRTYALKTTESFLDYFGIDANEEADIKKYLEIRLCFPYLFGGFQ